MKPELERLARHRLSRAREAFAEGEQLLATGGLMGAVNRFYYPGFYAARALLAMQEARSIRDEIRVFLDECARVLEQIIAERK